MRALSPLFGTGTLELGTHYHFTPTSNTRDTVRKVGPFLPLLRAGHTCGLTELRLWTLRREHSLRRTEESSIISLFARVTNRCERDYSNYSLFCF